MVAAVAEGRQEMYNVSNYNADDGSYEGYVVDADDTTIEDTANKIVEKYNLGNAQTITRNKRALVERGFIDKTENSYFFCDPVFELWFKQELM